MDLKDETSGSLGLRQSIKDLVSLAKAVATGSDDEVKIPEASNFTNYTLSQVGLHLTLYDDNDDCQLEQIGSKAKVMWLWQTARCTPLFMNGQFTREYYFLNESHVKLMCDDDQCSNCVHHLNHYNSQLRHKCYDLKNGASFHFEKPLIYSWPSRQPTKRPYVANVFFQQDFCDFPLRYREPQVITSHVNLGYGNETCFNSIRFQVKNESMVESAYWVSHVCSWISS